MAEDYESFKLSDLEDDDVFQERGARPEIISSSSGGDTGEHRCCSMWAPTLDEVYGRLDELFAHHKTLARLVKHIHKANDDLGNRLNTIENKLEDRKSVV